MSHRRRSSTASYAPVLINPTPHSPSQPTSHSTPPSTPRITYPYPLTFLALVDLAYTVYQSRQSSIPTHLIVLSALRCGVLTLVLGLNKRWRNRGGWVAIISTFTLGAVVWEVCDAELRKDKEGESTTTLHVVFLGTTAALALAEFILFLLLLRLSPLTHRNNPLSLRLPHSAIQSPTAFPFTSDEHEPLSVTLSPISAGYQGQHQDTTRHTLIGPSSLSNGHVLASSPPSDHGNDNEEGYNPEMVDDDDDDNSDSISSVSESSIIDLPSPLSPARIVPPTGMSMNGGLNLVAAIDAAPLIGEVVRRTRSARFLGRSWASRTSDGEEREGYGTFGNRRPNNVGMQ